MATTGARNVCSTTNLVAASGNLVGQGGLPEAWILYSTDEASDTDPLWQDATAKVRSFSVSRGRESELAEINAGTATVVLDNRTRTFDPVAVPAIRPMNRWWIREQFTGETQSIFLGYAESYDQTWSKGGTTDAVATVSCVDEFKVLALDRLPVTDPPRDTYADVVASDEPASYWRMDDDAGTLQAVAVVGEPLTSNAAITSTASLVTGDLGAAISLAPTVFLTSPVVDTNSMFDISDLDSFTFETWFQTSDATPAALDNIAAGPASGGTVMWRVDLNTTGTVRAQIRQGGITYTATSTQALADSTTYHLAVTVVGANVLIYINGVQAASAARAGTFGAVDAAATMIVRNSAGSATMTFDEMAFWRRGLSADRIAAHYQAGADRGFPEQTSRQRIDAVLDSVDNTAPRAYYDAGGSYAYMLTDVVPTFMHGQAPLDECRRALDAENLDAMFFVANDGTLTLLARNHRDYSGYSTVQATFDDDGTDLPYQDLVMDYSEAFLFNDINVTREGGLTQHNQDLTSISRYYKRTLSLTGLPILTDGEADIISFALLNKYSVPFTRITSLTLYTSTAAVTEAVFRLELGERIRVFRTAPGGGTRIDQSVWIQKIDVDASPGGIWQIKLGVSPL